MKRLVWAEYAGGVGMGALQAVVEGGKFLSNVKDIDVWTPLAIAATDILVSDHLHPAFESVLNGAGSGAVTVLTQVLLQKEYLPPVSATSTSATTTGAKVYDLSPIMVERKSSQPVQTTSSAQTQPFAQIDLYDGDFTTAVR